MWIASNIGFYSIVKKTSHLNEDGPEVHVIRARDKDDNTDSRLIGQTEVHVIRARDRDDLARLLAKPGEASDFKWRESSVTRIHDWDYSDYRYRIYVENSEDFTAIFDALNSTITYDNFKDEIKATPQQRKKYKAYEMLWFGIMDAHRKVHSEGRA